MGLRSVNRLSQSSNPAAPGLMPPIGPMKFLQRKHVIHHLAKCMNFATRTALHHFPGEFGGPLQNATWALQSRGHQADHITQSALACVNWSQSPHRTNTPGSLNHSVPVPPLSAGPSGPCHPNPAPAMRGRVMHTSALSPVANQSLLEPAHTYNTHHSHRAH